MIVTKTFQKLEDLYLYINFNSAHMTTDKFSDVKVGNLSGTKYKRKWVYLKNKIPFSNLLDCGFTEEILRSIFEVATERKDDRIDGNN